MDAGRGEETGEKDGERGRKREKRKIEKGGAKRPER